jgi:hypothetical protein
MTLHITPGSKRNKYAKYLEAWDLLMEESVVVEAEKAGSSLSLRSGSE